MDTGMVVHIITIRTAIFLFALIFFHGNVQAAIT